MVVIANTEIRPTHNRLMDPRETAQYLKLDERTVTRWARKAYLPAHPLGEGKRKFWRFYENELSSWLSAQTNGVDLVATLSPIQVAGTAIDGTADAPPRSVPPASFIARTKAPVNVRSRRYQQGSLSMLKHKNAPDTWVFRYYAHESGRRVYKRKTIGSVRELPKSLLLTLRP